jgi:hypothetical protein
MSAWQTAVTTAASSAAALIAMSALARRWLVRVIQGVVDASATDLLRRQSDFERRQGEHLDRQDLRLDRIETILRGRRR